MEEIKQESRKIAFNKIFKDANMTRKRYRILKGSAGSGKSVNIALDYIMKLSDKRFTGANLLVLRKAAGSNANSTFAELVSAVYRIWGDLATTFWHISNNPMRMRCLLTGNEIIFGGMYDRKQRERLKSITFKQGKLTWAWCEEATEFTQQDIEILDDRLRGELDNPALYYQITLSFNPISATHWIKRVYFDYQDENTFTHQSTYRDNKFVDKDYYDRMERRKVTDPEGYQIYGLGNWGNIGGVILKNFIVEDKVPKDDYFDAIKYGHDFGYNHANAVLKVGFKDVTTQGGDLYILDELVTHEKYMAQVIDMLNERGWRKDITMYCDSAEQDRIKQLSDSGFMARGVNKGGSQGSVLAQIDILKRLKIHIAPQCVHTIKEIQQWSWQKDDVSGQYLDKPVDVFDDAMAALRYSIEEVRRGDRDIHGYKIDI